MHAVGYPVAMGNAKEHIRRAAGRVTESNQNDGVAIAIQTILKGGELPLYQ
ncbi:MAG: HAD hydrolase family protein [Pygmaiobacter massiliensis]|nr:HAD hydrolase family protein [Pygmaiobacter massiliensis]